MRAALFYSLLFALPSASAAPVPKELRKSPLAGTWELTTTNLWGENTPQYNGQRWRFGTDGTFTISERTPGGGYAKPRLNGSYAVGSAGLEILFGEKGTGNPARTLSECEGAMLRLVNTKKNEVRAADFRPHPDSVIYTFKRVEE
jgi:hypothetical protein